MNSLPESIEIAQTLCKKKKAWALAIVGGVSHQKEANKIIP